MDWNWGVGDPISRMFANQRTSREVADKFREMSKTELTMSQVFNLVTAVFNLVFWLVDRPTAKMTSVEFWQITHSMFVEMSREDSTDPDTPMRMEFVSEKLEKRIKDAVPGYVSCDHHIRVAAALIAEDMSNRELERASRRAHQLELAKAQGEKIRAQVLAETLAAQLSEIEIAEETTFDVG